MKLQPYAQDTQNKGSLAAWQRLMTYNEPSQPVDPHYVGRVTSTLWEGHPHHHGVDTPKPWGGTAPFFARGAAQIHEGKDLPHERISQSW